MDVSQIKVNVKRFFSNPNTLTFLLVIALIVFIYFIYSWVVNQAVSPSSVPYALTEISSGTEITSDMVGTVKISGSFVTSSSSNLIQTKGSIIGKYVASGYHIPESSFFYSEQLVDEEVAEQTVVSDAPDGYTVFALDVDFDSTYGCSIMSGNYIDLYLKAEDDNHEIMFGRFIKSIKVTRVVDSDGYDVFTSTEDGETPKPAKIYFIVPVEFSDLLHKALLIGNIEIIPVPRNAGYSENPEETEIVNEEFESFIESKAVSIS